MLVSCGLMILCVAGSLVVLILLCYFVFVFCAVFVCFW